MNFFILPFLFFLSSCESKIIVNSTEKKVVKNLNDFDNNYVILDHIPLMVPTILSDLSIPLLPHDIVMKFTEPVKFDSFNIDDLRFEGSIIPKNFEIIQGASSSEVILRIEDLPDSGSFKIIIPQNSIEDLAGNINSFYFTSEEFTYKKPTAQSKVLINNIPAISINDLSVAENATNATLTITLNTANDKSVTLDYTTSNNTAVAGSEYTTTSGSLTFSPGQTSKTVNIPIIDNVISNNDKTFFLDLSNPSNATFSDNQGIVTINDNEGSRLTIADLSVAENGTNTVSTISIDTIHEENITVDWATADGSAVDPTHYTSSSGTAIIIAGQTSTTISVPVVDDAIYNNSRNFFIHLSSPTNASISDNQSTVTITNEDANSAPTVDTNTGATVRQYSVITISSSMLSSSDVDGHTVTYTITSLSTQGLLRLSGSSIGIGDTFTQSDIDGGRLTYIQSVNSDTSIGFKISDGINEVTGQTFAITGTTACNGLAGATSHTEIGIGSSANWPYVICNTAQWDSLGSASADWGKNYFIGLDLDLTALSPYQVIGNTTTPFTGSVEGNNKTLSNLSINAPTTDELGVFGVIDGGKISNLNLSNITITSQNNSGLMVGLIISGTIENGVVSGSIIGQSSVGAIVGQMNGGTLQHYIASGLVFGSHQVGGIIGIATSTSNINVLDVHAFTDVSLLANGNSAYIGGFIGQSGDLVTITSSSSNGLVAANFSTFSSGAAGGFIGDCLNSTSISNSYFTGKITGLTTGGNNHRVGGFVGNCIGTDISNSYSSGVIETENSFHVGGFAGVFAGNILNSYTLSHINSSGNISAGGFIGKLSDTLNVNLTKNYANNIVIASGTIGGFIGDNAQTTGSYSLVSNIWNKSLNGTIKGLGDASTDPNLITLLKDEIETQSFFTTNGFDFATTPIWKVSSLIRSPLLNWEADSFVFDSHLRQNRPIGSSSKSSFAISGDCPTNGDLVKIYVKANEFLTTCSSNRWNYNLNMSGYSDGDINVSVAFFNASISANTLKKVISRNFVLDTTCDSDTNSTAFASGGDGSIGSPWIVCHPSEIEAIWAGEPILSDFISIHDDINLSTAIGSTPINYVGPLFEGNNFEISNLVISNPGNWKVGFFGNLSNASTVIQNIGFVDPQVTGAGQTGVAIGLFSGNKAENIWVRSTNPALINLTSGWINGGIIGDLSLGNATRLWSRDLKIVPTGGASGGIVGASYAGTTVSNSYSDNLTIDTSGGAFNSIGGIIGLNDQTNIYSSYVTGSITSGGVMLGGLVGKSINNIEIDSNFTAVNLTSTNGTWSAIGGLIGVANDNLIGTATIHNNHATGNVTSDEQEVGGLIGVIYLGSNGISTISNSYTTGNVTATYDLYIGGLIGHANANISNSWSSSNIYASSGVAGGLVGELEVGTITSSYATGNVEGSQRTGGLVGRSLNATTISNSWASGDVLINADNGMNVGGLIGQASGDANNSYATGNINISSYLNFDSAGGFVGDIMLATSNFINNYSTGNILGSGINLGGFDGYVSGTGATIVGNYWDTSTSLSTSYTESAGIIEGKITSDLQQQLTFSGWDFTTIWSIDEGNSYPVHQ